MAKYTSFKDMSIWQISITLAEKIFYLTNALPKKEDYGYTSQIRRSALSISANIAEAYGRNHIKEKINFYYIARGSLTETQSHLEYGLKVGYIRKIDKDKIDKILVGLYNDINKIVKTIKAYD